MNREQLHQSIQQAVQLSFTHSGGKGGQNVNKLNTKVHASIPLDTLQGLTCAELSLVSDRLCHAINQNGELYVSTQQERTQELNRAIALKRLETWIVDAAVIPKIRHQSAPSRSVQEKRMQCKRIRSAVKSQRKHVSAYEE